MKLFEFADDDPLRVKLTAVASQLKSIAQGSTSFLSSDDLVTILNKNGISLDKSDLFDMVKKEPLKNIISDINDNKVTFKGQSGSEDLDAPDKDESEKVRQQMAKKALK